MNGNNFQYDPSEMFKDWIQKGGKAQAEFMKNFASMMTPKQNFDPLETLKEMTNKATETQTNIMDNFSSMQTKGMNKMFNISQLMPNFLQWGAYKTSIGSSGRISIPEAEREALGLKEGDLVQVIVLPIEKKSKRR
jgi:AbrB family looped-hinge helix DNA binding protein